MGAEMSTSSPVIGHQPCDSTSAATSTAMALQLQSSSRSHASTRGGSSHGRTVETASSSLGPNIVKPNKVKKNHSYFHSKPSTLIDLIVNKDWQRVMNRCTSHSKEIYVTQKIRLYGIDWKLLPLHIACAMRPPKEVISSLLRPDTKTGMSTVKTVVQNSFKKEKKNKKKKKKDQIKKIQRQKQQQMQDDKKEKNNGMSITRMKKNWKEHANSSRKISTETNSNTMEDSRNNHHQYYNDLPQITIQSTASSLTNSISNNTFMDGEVDGHHDLCKEVVEPPTCKTAPLSPGRDDYDFDSDDDDDDEDDEEENNDNHGDDDDDEEEEDSFMRDDNYFFSQHDLNYCNQIFFPDKVHSNRPYALQITPSGQVKQISPNGKSCRHALDTESPFVYASLFHTKNGTENEVDNMHAHQGPASIMQSYLADDFLPIHIACLYRASPEVIKLLIQCYPEGVEQKNNWGMLPLHMVCSNYSMEPPNIRASKLDSDFTTKAYLNNLYKESIDDEENKWEMEKVVSMLVEAFPQSVNIPSDNIEWYTPLEYVTRNIKMGQGREEVTGILKRAQEQQYNLTIRGTGASTSIGAGISCDGQSLGSSLSGSRASNGIGIKAFYIADCPLLYTYISGKQWDRTIERLQKAPEEASYWVVDKDYPRLPIHLACSHSAPKNVVEYLLDAYPEGCSAKEGSGCHPLHLACEKALAPETVALLLKRARKAARVKDEIGRLPLHLACASGANIAVIKALIDAYPQSCYIKDYNGHTALTYAYYCIEDDAVKNELSFLFQRCEERLFGGGGTKSRNTDDQECRLEDEEFDVMCK